MYHLKNSDLQFYIKQNNTLGVHRQVEEQRLTFIKETGQTMSAFRITGPGAAYGFCPEKLHSVPGGGTFSSTLT